MSLSLEQVSRLMLEIRKEFAKEGIRKENMSTTGKKFDAGKPDMTHVPIEAMYAMAEAFTYGAKKYEADNYREGLFVRRQIAAALRHIYQFLDEGNIDAESGCKHIGSALASLAMAAYTVEKRPEFDDRYWVKKLRQDGEPRSAKIDEGEYLNKLAVEKLKGHD